MKSILYSLLLLGIVPGLAAATPNLLILGDSLSAAHGLRRTDGWVHLLQQRLAQQGLPFQVVNASISGDTTAGGLARLPPLLRDHQPVLVVLALGSNDGLRGLGLEQLRSNLQALIDACRQAGAQVLMVGGILPPNYGALYNQRFAAVFRDLAAKEQVPLVPTLLAGLGDDLSMFQADGLHPTAAAQPRMLDNLWAELSRQLDQLPSR